MAKFLPPNPSLDHLKAEAKALLKGLEAGDPKALATIRLVSKYSKLSDAEIRGSDVVLREMQHALALEYGFQGWKELKETIEGRRESKGILHIHCGDSSAGSLRASQVPGKIITWYDPLLQGPTPSGVSYEEWLHIRGQSLNEDGWFSSNEAAVQSLRDMDKNLEQFPRFDEVVLWFDACLFDQLILIRQLDWFAQRDLGKTKLSLICIGEFPGFKRFRGLGELMPDKIATLMPQRHEVSKAETELAVRAWAAYRSPDLRAIEDVLAGDTSVLPYLGSALKRHLQRFPNSKNGLCRMQRKILELVKTEELNFGPLFARLSEMDHPPFFGDNVVMACLQSMANGPAPVIHIEGPAYNPREPGNLGQWRIRILPQAEQILSGRVDFVRTNGIDTWLGGVHLQGRKPTWRWDEADGKIVKM